MGSGSPDSLGFWHGDLWKKVGVPTHALRIVNVFLFERLSFCWLASFSRTELHVAFRVVNYSFLESKRRCNPLTGGHISV